MHCLAAQSIYKRFWHAPVSAEPNCCQLAIPEDSALPFNDRFAWLPKHLAKTLHLDPCSFSTQLQLIYLGRSRQKHSTPTTHCSLWHAGKISLVHRIRKRLLRQGWTRVLHFTDVPSDHNFLRDRPTNTMAVWLYKNSGGKRESLAHSRFQKWKGLPDRHVQSEQTRHAEDPWVQHCNEASPILWSCQHPHDHCTCVKALKKQPPRWYTLQCLITGKTIKVLSVQHLDPSPNSLRMFFSSLHKLRKAFLIFSYDLGGCSEGHLRL